MVNSYVVAGLIFVLSCVGSYALGWKQKGAQAEAQIAAIKADLGERLAKAQARAAEVRERVVIQYRDRIKVVREVPQEVTHEIEVIRNSDCVLPAEFVRVYRSSAGLSGEASGGADEAAPISCADAAESITEQNKRFQENAIQLEALQSWAAGVSSP